MQRSAAGDVNVMDAGVFRRAVGHYASGVTVISGVSGGAPVGFTCQSFFSVSLDPMLVSFSVMASSTTYPAIRDAGRCAVNILAGDQHQVADQFARTGTDKWAGISWRPSPTGNPLIAGTVMWLDCDLWNEYPAGDHTIVIARVLGMGPDAAADAGEPLLYFRGGYRTLQSFRDTERHLDAAGA